MTVPELNTAGLLDPPFWIGPIHLKIFAVWLGTTPRVHVEFWPSARPSFMDQTTIGIDGRIHISVQALNQTGIISDWTQPIPVTHVVVP
jgi:hypothetical protein